MIRSIKRILFRKLTSLVNKYTAYKKELVKASFKSCGTNVIIDEPTIIHYHGHISIGSNVYINSFCHFWGLGGITIGDNVMIASHCAITSITHSKETELFNEKNITREVIIEENVWIGAHVVILPGVRIGKNSIIGAGAVVNKDVAPNSVYVGVPARKIEELNQFER